MRRASVGLLASGVSAVLVSLLMAAGCAGADGAEAAQEGEARSQVAQALVGNGEGEGDDGLHLFHRAFPGGNGRACATCHRPEDGFALSPETAEKLYQANPSDPLFRSIDADDGADDYTMLRTRGLVRVHVKLPVETDDQGNAVRRVWLTDHPEATEVTVWRAVPSILNSRDTAPYQQDRGAPTLEAQAFGALHAHIEPRFEPSPDFFAKIAGYERDLFSSDGARALSDALASGQSPLPDPEPELTDYEKLGKAHFDNFCGRCHGGPTQTQNFEDRIFGTDLPHAANVVVSNPPPDGFPTDDPIIGPGRDLPAQRFTVLLPDGSTTVLLSSDPGTLLTGTETLRTVAGNRVFNRFDIPQLRGVSKTAPYFHDNRAKTLREVVVHYQKFFWFIHTVRKLPLPLIPDEAVDPMVAYLQKI